MEGRRTKTLPPPHLPRHRDAAGADGHGPGPVTVLGRVAVRQVQVAPVAWREPCDAGGVRGYVQRSRTDVVGSSGAGSGGVGRTVASHPVGATES